MEGTKRLFSAIPRFTTRWLPATGSYLTQILWIAIENVNAGCETVEVAVAAALGVLAGFDSGRRQKGLARLIYSLFAGVVVRVVGRYFTHV